MFFWVIDTQLTVGQLQGNDFELFYQIDHILMGAFYALPKINLEHLIRRCKSRFSKFINSTLNLLLFLNHQEIKFS